MIKPKASNGCLDPTGSLGRSCSIRWLGFIGWLDQTSYPIYPIYSFYVGTGVHTAVGQCRPILVVSVFCFRYRDYTNAIGQLHMQDLEPAAVRAGVANNAYIRCLVQRIIADISRMWALEGQRVLSWEPHPIRKRGSLTIRQALLYCYKYTCHSCGNRFFYRSAQVARQNCRHFGSSIVDLAK